MSPRALRRRFPRLLLLLARRPAQETTAFYRAEIDAGTATPLYHLMGGIFVTSYILAWPVEYRHMTHALHAKAHGEEHH